MSGGKESNGCHPHCDACVTYCMWCREYGAYERAMWSDIGDSSRELVDGTIATNKKIHSLWATLDKDFGVWLDKQKAKPTCVCTPVCQYLDCRYEVL